MKPNYDLPLNRNDETSHSPLLFNSKKDSLPRFRGRLHAEEAADILGFQAHDIPILVASKLLRPLGNPTQNSVKYFAGVTIFQLAHNPEWLDKATKVIAKYWKNKNSKKDAKTSSLPQH